MFGDLAMAVKEVGSLEADTLVDEELTTAVVELATLRSALEAAEARLDAAWDTRRSWAADGARSARACLAHKTREAKGACGSRLWLGRVLAEMDLVAEAWAAGEISADHVRRLVKARNPRTAEAFERDQALLVHHARTLDFERFVRMVDYWVLRADPDGADASEMERRERRRVSLDRTIGGMWSGLTLLDPVSGTIVSGELERLEAEMFDADWAEARTRLGREPQVGDLARTSDQRRADAMVEMARRSSGADGTSGAKPLFTLVLGSTALAHLCQLANGQVVSPAAVVPWIADAELERVLFAGESGRVIDVSRKRSFTGALRRLIEVRDRFCYHPTCDEPASRCQVDHIQPWAAGGMTEQSNGRLACGFHNRLRHQRPPPGAP